MELVGDQDQTPGPRGNDCWSLFQPKFPAISLIAVIVLTTYWVDQVPQYSKK